MNNRTSTGLAWKLGVLTSVLLFLANRPEVALGADDVCEQLFRSTLPRTKLQPLTDDQVLKLTEQRVCILSFPWPNVVDRNADDLWNQSASVLAQARIDFARLTAEYDRDWAWRRGEFADLNFQGRARRLAGLLGGEDLQKIYYLNFRLGGGDTNQLELYAIMLQVKALKAEGKFSDALALITDAWNKYGLKIAVRGFDRAEEHSYLSTQTLSNFLASHAYLARLKTIGTSPADRLALVTAYLDSRDAIESVMASQIGPGDFDDAMSSMIAQTQLSLSGNSAEVLTTLKELPNLQGFLKTSDETVLYVKGSAMHAVRIADGSADFLSPEEAATTLRDYCRSAVSEQSNPNMALFNVLPLGDRVEVDLPGETLTLTRADYDKVRGGKALPDDHPLTMAVAKLNRRSLVSFSNPLGLKPGYYQEESDQFVFGLSRSYTGTRVHRDPMSPRTAAMAAALDGQTVVRGDVVAVVADQTLANVKDGNVILNMASENGILTQAGIPVIRFNKAGDGTWKGPRQKKLIVISGHSDEELKRFVQALGEAGFLENNYIIFNSCESPLTRELMTDIVGQPLLSRPLFGRSRAKSSRAT